MSAPLYRLLTAKRLPPPAIRAFGYKSTARASVEEREGLKTIEDLPGSGLLSTFYWHFIKGYHQKAHEFQIVQKKMFGPIWKTKFGPITVINVATANLIEQVLRQEGKYPVRSQMPHWREYRELRGKAYGPLCEYGEKWHHMRSILNPKMLKPKEVSTYSPAINEVVTDFVKRVQWVRENHGQGVMLNDVSGELYKFAFEAICTILFETRMGCLEEHVPEETDKFIKAVFEMFHFSSIVIFFPKSLWPYLSLWKQFVAAWDYIFYITEKLVDKKMSEMQEHVEKGYPVDGEYLTYLLANTKMTPLEIYGSLCELLLAAVDTTSNTTAWILYNLARDPSIQQQLYEEVTSVCPGDQIPEAKDFANMPFLKAVAKETLRMYPVVPGNSRVAVDKEVVAGGYYFPKNTLFHLCHYAVSQEDSEFSQSRSFQPSRWLREKGEEMKKHHPFASIPFGFGTRTCLGKRVAELEMFSVISRVIKLFEIRPDPSGKVVMAKTRTLLCPGSPINLQLIDRKCPGA
ncbi:sterol 26-hydroxylase, mitochondrial [Stegostoma tigrinum]|uniref:sterol 26-hydroxylase, mitochondrial n=1 Tax=Stegostoma tigrinum TaxID=3053191 RepID=UPI002870112B|nr:sterol 26-hydroxylase, mitochondrial [Stegostoma tigrinum]